MKLKLMFLFWILSIYFHFPAKAEKSHATIAILAEVGKAEFESKFLPVLQKELEGCAQCSYMNITPYAEGGEFDPKGIISAIQSNIGKFQILFFNWNEKANTQNKALVDYIQSLESEGITVVASAGQPKLDEPSSTLSKTIFGQNKKAIIIGEIGEKDRLIGQSYYGPEMLTALRPPKGLVGQGYSPLIFAARLTKNYHRRTDWIEHFQEKKSKTKKVWLDLGDLF